MPGMETMLFLLPPDTISRRAPDGPRPSPAPEVLHALHQAGPTHLEHGDEPRCRHGTVIRNTLLVTVARPGREEPEQPWERAVAEPRFSLDTRGDSVVASVQGELDVTSSQRFDDFLADAAAGGDRVILDMSGIDFMDTTALAVIVGHWRRQLAAGGAFLLAGARYRYTKALWITGLADRLPMYGTVEEALAAQTEPGAAAGSGRGAREPGEPDAARRQPGGRES